MLLFNDFKEQHEKGKINLDNYPKYLKMIEPNQEAYDMIIEFVKENGLGPSEQVQKEEKVIVRRGQEIPVKSNTKLSDEERKQLRRAFLGPLDRAGVKMQVDRLKAYYENPERNLTEFNIAIKALGLEGKSEAKIRDFIKQAEDNDFNI
jgi:hypothetical protein